MLYRGTASLLLATSREATPFATPGPLDLKIHKSLMHSVPKRTRFRKSFKGRYSGYKKDQLHFGQYGIQACAAGRIHYQTIEAARRALSRQFRRSGQIWVRIFPDIPVTSKPTEVRMGKGKGNPSGWIVRVKEGQILFEMNGISLAMARKAAQLAAHKLNLPTQFLC